jgi:phosphatidylglycerol---prolipoprotein diacylglyceryl transferase
MSAVVPSFAAIPYTTFPDIPIGPLTLRTFGLMVALGVLVGTWIGARVAERDWEVPRDDTYRLATRMVIAAIIGARLAWDVTHWDQIENPIDLIAVWEGGLQFAGGFIAAVLVGIPVVRRWRGHIGWGVADAFLYGLAAGMAIGRIGCYAVGEHFGGVTDFALASRWEGGVPPDVREPELGDIPLVDGVTFHNTSLYEFLHLVLLFILMTVLRRRGASTGTLAGVFCLWYGVARLFTDYLRVNDDRVLGLTGAQYLSIILIFTGLAILARVRPRLAAAAAAADDEEPESEDEEPESEPEPESDDDVESDEDESDAPADVPAERESKDST